MTQSSKPFARWRTSWRSRSSAGASMSLELGIRAAGWASQVGYQKDRISRRRLVAGSRSPVEPCERGGVQEQGSHRGHLAPCGVGLPGFKTFILPQSRLADNGFIC